MYKDWTGNKTSVFTVIGASNHSAGERQEHDYYATDPKAMELLLEVEDFAPVVWECACGEGHLSNVLKSYGYEVICTDLIDRGSVDYTADFLKHKPKKGFRGDIITNPPYKKALEFVEKALESVIEGRKVAMFLKLTFLEGQKRKKFFEKSPPKIVYVCSSRIDCAKNGDFEKWNSKAICYAWFVWEKGYKGDTVVKWIG